MSSILAAEIADYRHAELMAEAEMMRRARLARRGPVGAGGTVRPVRSSPLRRPLPALRAWLVAGQL